MLLLKWLMENKSNRKKILIIRLGAIGDSIHATIIPYAIKQKHPDWQVDYLTHESLVPLLKECSYIDNLVVWKSGIKNKNAQMLALAAAFRKEGYDIIFNMSLTLRNIILTVLSAPKKIVNKKEFGKSWVENFYLTAKSAIKDLELPDRLLININPEALISVQKEIASYKRPYFVIAPGGSSDYTRQGRIWNIDKWAELAKLLIQNFGGTVFICGNKNETEYHSKITGESIVALTGKYTLPESSALFSLADLFLSCDTGPIHIASAHNVKTLELLGSTSPDKIKPYGKNGYYIEPKIQCKYCWKKKCKFLQQGEKYTPCIESITPDDVIEKIKKEKLISGDY